MGRFRGLLKKVYEVVAKILKRGLYVGGEIPERKEKGQDCVIHWGFCHH